MPKALNPFNEAPQPQARQSPAAAIAATPAAAHVQLKYQAMRLLPPLLVLILSLTPLISARQEPTSYCKCICFANSTIIPLNSSPSTTHSHPALARSEQLDERAPAEPSSSSTPAKHHKLTCNDCNRAFCLDYNLPICRDAKEEDVFATCFRKSQSQFLSLCLGTQIELEQG